MKIFKSHFWYSKSQRNGIFLLITVVLILQAINFINPFTSDEIIDTKKPELLALQYQIDSLKAIEIENGKPKIFPFNPNYITDYKGEQLGMSIEEIDRLLHFRKTNKFINSPEQFQLVTKISDSLLLKMAPYFKFPEWVQKRNEAIRKQRADQKSVIPDNGEKSSVVITTVDINEATIYDLQRIHGIGEVLSERIIKYRSKLQGFSFTSQLYEVWGLDKKLADEVLKRFKIIKKPIIKKININTAEFKDVLKIPYIDYELCKKIFNYRDEVAELQNISELTNIKDFPMDAYDRIVLYLQAE